MATFFEQLWESIFTPGPTPSLLIAANVTFACLQTLLAVLLLATYSVHFIVLSGLCGGLWWSINWFARELKASQKREEDEKAHAARAASRGLGALSESETEVETPAAGPRDEPATGSTEVETVEPRGELKHRSAGLEEPAAGTKSGVSTEDEWEKVSESGKDK